MMLMCFQSRPPKFFCLPVLREISPSMVHDEHDVTRTTNAQSEIPRHFLNIFYVYKTTPSTSSRRTSMDSSTLQHDVSFSSPFHFFFHSYLSSSMSSMAIVRWLNTGEQGPSVTNDTRLLRRKRQAPLRFFFKKQLFF